MPGYDIDVHATETVATAMTQVATCSDHAKEQLDGVPSIGAPAAGNGIGGDLKAFVQAWQDVLPKLSTEVKTLGDKARSVAKVAVDIEEDVYGHFEAFTR